MHDAEKDKGDFGIDLGDVPTYHVDAVNTPSGPTPEQRSLGGEAGIFNDPRGWRVGTLTAEQPGGLRRTLSSRHLTFIGFGGGIGVGG